MIRKNKKITLKSFFLLHLLLIVITMLFEVTLRKYYSRSLIAGYTIISFNVFFIAIMIISTFKVNINIMNNRFLPLVYIIVYSFINRAFLYLFTPWDRDSPTLLKTVKLIEYYGLNPPSEVLSKAEQFYLQHPGLQIFGLIDSKILGISIGEQLIYLFLLLSTIIIPILIYLWAKNLYNEIQTALAGAFLALTINIYIAYANFSRGMLAIPMMFSAYIFFSKLMEKQLSISVVPIIILILALVNTHDFTALLMLSYVLIYPILPILQHFVNTLLLNKKLDNNKNLKYYFKNRIYLLILTILVFFFIYELYQATITVKILYNTLFKFGQTERISTLTIQHRSISSIIATILRIIFWVSSAIVILHHFKKVFCNKKRIDIHLAAYTLLIAVISLITSFLPVRLLYYSYVTLVILLSHILIKTKKQASSKKYLSLTLFSIFVIFNIISLPSFLIAYNQAIREEQSVCDFSYTLSFEDLSASEWIHSYSSSSINRIAGDFRIVPLFKRYPISIRIIKEITLTKESYSNKNIIFFWKSPYMDYFLIYKPGDCSPTPQNFLAFLLLKKSLIYNTDSIKIAN